MMKTLSCDLLFHLIPFLTNKSFYALGTTNKAIEKIWPWRQRLMIPPPWTHIRCRGYMNVEPGQEDFELGGDHFDILHDSAGRNFVYYNKGYEEEIKRVWIDRFGEDCPPLQYECDWYGILKVPFDFHPLNIDNCEQYNNIIIIYCNGKSLSEVIKWFWPMIVEARKHNI